MVERYRPSNGTEGEAFEARFCDRCAEEERLRAGGDASCMIHMATYAFDVDHECYPAEWIVDHAGPRCTAFRPEGTGTMAEVERDRQKYDAAMAEMRAAPARKAVT